METLTESTAAASAETTSTALPVVRGALPEALDGVFVRVGSGCAPHALRTEPLAAGLRLRGGRAEWFRTRWVRTDRVCRALGELATPGPRRGLSDRADAGLVRHAGRTFAVGDGGVLPHELSPDLSTRARYDFDGTLTRGFASHPLHDPLTGELFAAAYHPEAPYVQHVIVDTGGHVRRAEPISVKNTSMMHAYSLTEHYAVLYDLPVVFNPGPATSSRGLPYSWDDSYGARLGVLPREGGDADVEWFEIEPCYVFHPFNSYEDRRGRLVIDAVRHDRAFDRDPTTPGETPPVPWRWTVDLVNGGVREEQLDDAAVEFPTVDARICGSRHRHGFATTVEPTTRPYGATALLHRDFATNRTERHEFGAGSEVGDPVFVPRDADASEGDGWILVYVRDRRTDKTEFHVLDTSDFTGDPAATVALPASGPRGFHSTWLAD